jgi:hypothetical protein
MEEITRFKEYIEKCNNDIMNLIIKYDIIFSLFEFENFIKYKIRYKNKMQVELYNYLFFNKHYCIIKYNDNYMLYNFIIFDKENKLVTIEFKKSIFHEFNNLTFFSKLENLFILYKNDLSIICLQFYIVIDLNNIFYRKLFKLLNKYFAFVYIICYENTHIIHETNFISCNKYYNYRLIPLLKIYFYELSNIIYIKFMPNKTFLFKNKDCLNFSSEINKIKYNNISLEFNDSYLINSVCYMEFYNELKSAFITFAYFMSI